MSTAIPSRLSLVGTVREGNTIEVQWMVGHPMESGFRLDDAGRPIRRNIIERIRVSLNDRLILQALPGTGLSAHPFLAFSLVVPPGLGLLKIEWVDDQGQSGQIQKELR